MPYRSGIFQAALGAISAVAFIISGSFRASPSKENRLTGRIRRTGSQTFEVTDANERRHCFELSTPVEVFLNEKQISLNEIPDGRQVSVRYTKKGKLLTATLIDVFPTHGDMEAG